MSTPNFTSLESLLAAVRFYTQFDPYHYSTDNRPLTDLDSNIKSLISGIDAARRVSAIGTLVSGFLGTAANGAIPAASGLVGYDAGSGNFVVTAGALAVSGALSTADATNYVKVAYQLTGTTFPISAPASSSYSQAYTIWGQYVDITSSNSSAITIPLTDVTNAGFTQACQFGQLVLGIAAGAPAPTGSQVTPPAPAGTVALYTVVATYGTTALAWSTPIGAPARAGLKKMSFQAKDLNAITANVTSNADGETTLYKGLPDGSTTSVAVVAGAPELKPANPHVRVRVSVDYTGDVNAGNFMVRFGYKELASGGSAALTSLSYPAGLETLPPPGSAGNVRTFVSAGYIPAGIMANEGSVGIVISREGADAGDTNTGTFRILSVRVEQI